MSTTRLRLLGWSASGFRCPDHELTFVDDRDKPYPITLIQMPNGTGKTTTLSLLRAALSGEAAKWDPHKVLQFRKKEGTSQTATFRLHALHNKSRLTIQMTFNFSDGTVQYATTLGAGQRRDFTPPTPLQRYLRPGFVNFFVFDGELAEHLLSPQYDSAAAVIEDLFQLRHFRHLEARINEYWNTQVEGRGATEEKGLSRRRNRVDLLRDRIKKLQEERDVLKSKYDGLRNNIDAKEKAFRAALEAQKLEREQLSNAENAVKDAEHNVEHLAQTLLSSMRAPHALAQAFATEMVTLKQSFDRVKLPQSAAREFFEELADDEACICGEKLDDDRRQAIRVRAQQYLGSEEVSLLNAMKRDVADQVGASPLDHENHLNGEIQKLLTATRAADEARTQLDFTRDSLVTNRPELKDVREEITALEQQASRLQNELSKYESADDSANDEGTFGIAVLQQRLENAEHKLAEITRTLELKAKRDILARILRKAHESARHHMCEELRSQANIRIESLMPHNELRIESINRSLELSGQEGASVGETLSVAYAFLSTLFNRAEHVLPFIVDSPANPIDLQVRRRVAELIPQLAEQFIAFTISSERAAFLEHLERASEQIQYITLFRKGPRDIEEAAQRTQRSTTSADGILVRGKDFFHKFHLDEEREK